MSRSIGRYEISEELGHGGMATVYLANDTRLSRQVALKLMNQALRHDPAFVARFEREAKTVAALEHPAIVSIHDYGEADDWLYLVMRYMKGGSLKDRIADSTLSPEEAYEVVRRIGGALDEAHRIGIVHRDLKPNNILLDQAGRAYLSDFGVLKVARGDTSYLTKTGEMVGTYAYMSPEQVRGEELDGRSDIYALGIVLYEMLTGKHPFGEVAGTSGAMAIAHANEPVPEIAADEFPDISPSMNDVIAKAMAKQAEDRYSSGEEMAVALQSVMAPRPAPPKTTPAVVAPPTERSAAPKKRATETLASEPKSFSPAPQRSAVRVTPAPRRGRVPAWAWAVAGLVAAIVAVVFLGERADRASPATPTSAPEDPAVVIEYPGTVRAISFSSDGELMASGVVGDSERPYTLWRAAGGNELDTLEGHTNTIGAVAFSPDGTTLASGASDDTVRLWRVADGSLLATLEGHTGGVDSVAFSPDGETLASGASDDTVRLWQVSDGSLLHTLEGHTGWVESVAFSPDGRILASGSQDATARLWRVDDGARLGARGNEQFGPVYSLAFSPDGEMLAIGYSIGFVQLARVSDWTLLDTMGTEMATVHSLAFSPDGTILAAGQRDDAVRLWQLADGDGSLLDTLTGHTSVVNSVAFSPDGQTLASGSSDNTVRLWETSLGE